MTNNTLLTIERKTAVLDRVGISRSNLHKKINDGLWVPPIRLGDRAVGFLVHETDLLLGAYILAKSKEQIRRLVQQLIALRMHQHEQNSVTDCTIDFNPGTFKQPEIDKKAIMRKLERDLFF